MFGKSVIRVNPTIPLTKTPWGFIGEMLRSFVLVIYPVISARIGCRILIKNACDALRLRHRYPNKSLSSVEIRYRRAVEWVLLLLRVVPLRFCLMGRLVHPLLLDVPRKDRGHCFFKDDGDVRHRGLQSSSGCRRGPRCEQSVQHPGVGVPNVRLVGND